MSRARLAVLLPHRELVVFASTVVTALRPYLQQGTAPHVERGRVLATVEGDLEQLYDDVHYTLWCTLYPGHRGLVEQVRFLREPIRDTAPERVPLTRVEAP